MGVIIHYAQRSNTARFTQNTVGQMRSLSTAVALGSLGTEKTERTTSLERCPVSIKCRGSPRSPLWKLHAAWHAEMSKQGEPA